MLTPAQQASRRGKLTGSDAKVLMTGTPAELINLWRGKIGDPDYVEEDLSRVFPVQLGSWTEPFHLDWIQLELGPITRRGEFAHHPYFPYFGCTLDGWSDLHNAPVEVKHVGGFETADAVVQRYMPQLHWQMWITDRRKACFSVIRGNQAPEPDWIEWNEEYGTELNFRARQFWSFVEAREPPSEFPPIAPPAKPERVVDMTGSNSWAANAVTWLTTKRAHADHEAAAKELKAAVPADAKRAFGSGIEAKRNKRGAITIGEI